MLGLGSVRLLLAISVLLLHADFVTFEVAQIAVLTFFFISGFLMERSFPLYSSWQRFIFNRLLRLLPSFLFVALLTWLIIVTTSDDFRRSFAFIYLRPAAGYGPEVHPPLSALASTEIDWKLPYLGFESELVPQAWSIGNEIIYYLTIPLLALLGLRWLLVIASLSIAFLGSQLLLRGDDFDYAIYTNLLATFSFFLAGYLTSRFLDQRVLVPHRLRRVSAFLALTLIVASYLLVVPDSLSIPIVIAYVVILSALVVLGFLINGRRPGAEAESALSRLLGDASYPLYASHMIVIGYLNYFSALTPLLLIFTALLAALTIHLLLDRPLERARRRIRSSVE